MTIVSAILGSAWGRAALGAIAFFTWLHFHDARVADRARNGYVLQVEKTAAEARAKEMARQLKIAQDAADEFRKELTQSTLAETRRSKELSDALTENEALRKSGGLTAADVEYIMCQRRGEPLKCRRGDNRAGFGSSKFTTPSK